MSRISTKQVDLQRFKSKDGSATVVKLMMACNDLSIVNESLEKWTREDRTIEKHKKIGAGFYFIRIGLSHVFEGLKVIKQIKSNPTLAKIVEFCDSGTKSAFVTLLSVTDNDVGEKKFKANVGRIRGSLAFHYDETEKQIEKAIEDRASRVESRYSEITRGTDVNLWRYNVADDIIDSIVVRQVWNIPPGESTKAEIGKIEDYLINIVSSFLIFGAGFIWKYAEGT